MANLHVLLVEDNPGDIRLTREAFIEADIQAKLSVVTDGESTIAFLEKKGAYAGEPLPDLILLDLNLPGWNGKEVLRKIKSEPGLLHIPVVVLTTSRSEQDIMECYQLHANCFISKPLDFEEFLRVIEKIKMFWLQTALLPSRNS